MRNLEPWVLAYLLNSVWQVPLLFACGWVAARALRTAEAALEHRGWVTVALLQSVLPACTALPCWPGLLARAWGASAVGQAQVSVRMGAGLAAGALHAPAAALLPVAILYGAVTVWFAGRFLLRCLSLGAIRRGAEPLTLEGDAALCWERCSERFGVRGARIAVSVRIDGPSTMGLGRKLVLLPSRMVARLVGADLEIVIAHEFAHMRRNDFLKNFLYELLALPVRYHPLCALTRERVTESREMVCDQMAAAFTGRRAYTRSLLRLASLLLEGAPATAAHAIGIFDANTLERRLMRLTENRGQMGAGRRAASLAGCAVLGMGMCGSAVALGLHGEAGVAAGESSAAKPAGPSMVSSGVMAGNVLTKVAPKYPDAAKRAKIQGAVVLEAVIGKDGTVENLQVVSGPEELAPSAIEAVRQWTYKPFLLNGDPVEVKTDITVTYSLAK